MTGKPSSWAEGAGAREGGAGGEAACTDEGEALYWEGPPEGRPRSWPPVRHASCPHLASGIVLQLSKRKRVQRKPQQNLNASVSGPLAISALLSTETRVPNSTVKKGLIHPRSIFFCGFKRWRFQLFLPSPFGGKSSRFLYTWLWKLRPILLSQLPQVSLAPQWTQSSRLNCEPVTVDGEFFTACLLEVLCQERGLWFFCLLFKWVWGAGREALVFGSFYFYFFLSSFHTLLKYSVVKMSALFKTIKIRICLCLHKTPNIIVQT